MKPILIVKLGSTLPSLAPSRGDFEDWIGTRLDVPRERVTVLDPKQDPLPEPWRFSGVILTGSHSMVTDHETWSERTAKWIPSVMEAQTPLLGICYGHQLIAYALGGDVGPNPRGREFGTAEIVLREAARNDVLFTGLPAKILAHTSHTQSVLRLPPGATWLASSRLDPHHAYAVGRTTWSVQFHPEFDVVTAKAYIAEVADLLRAQGDNPEHLQDSAAETPHAEDLLRRFATLAGIASPHLCARC